VEAVGAEEFAAEDGTTSALEWSSSRTSSSSSELLRMMTLPSPGDPRRPRLWSPKSFWVISSSREVLGKTSYSSEERSTTGNLSEGSSCLYMRTAIPETGPPVRRPVVVKVQSEKMAALKHHWTKMSSLKCTSA
jgi:hypothetical protein